MTGLSHSISGTNTGKMALAIFLLGRFARISLKCSHKYEQLINWINSKEKQKNGEKIQFDSIHISHSTKSIIGSSFSFPFGSAKKNSNNVEPFLCFALCRNRFAHTKFTSLKPKLKDSELICNVTEKFLFSSCNLCGTVCLRFDCSRDSHIVAEIIECTFCMPPLTNRILIERNSLRKMLKK